MLYHWLDYTPAHASVAESFMDGDARRFTGCEDGWEDYYTYWASHPDTLMGKNFWGKLVCLEDQPVAVIALALQDGRMTISEFVVSPDMRGKGHGSAILRELLDRGTEILGVEIFYAMAVIFPDNTASARAFEKAGFGFETVHPDGDAYYYVYKRDASRTK